MDQAAHHHLCFRFICATIATLVFCGGCGNDDPKNGNDAPNANPYAGLTIEIAIPASFNLTTDWQLPASEWGVQHEAECRMREYSLSADGREIAHSLIPNEPSSQERPEVLVIPWTAVADLMAHDALAEIPEDIQRPEHLNWPDYFPGLRNRVATRAQKPRLVPVSCPVLVCYYRQDLLEKAKLSPPRTWSEYQLLIETMDQWAPGHSAVEPWSESFRATMFLARSASVAKHPEQLSFCFQLSDAAPLIENPGFVASLKLGKAALQKMPDEVKAYSPGDCRREILTGRAALAIGYETEFSPDLVRGEDLQIGICPLPGSTRVYNTAINNWVEIESDRLHRVTLTGFAGWALAVSSPLETNLNNAAWEFARYMATDQYPASFPKSMVSLCRDSQVGTPSQWTGSQLTNLESDEYATAVADALRSEQIVLEFPLIGHARFREALTRGLTKAITESVSEEAILQAVAAEWREIIRQLGAEVVAKSHQRSHE